MYNCMDLYIYEDTVQVSKAKYQKKNTAAM